MDMSFSKKCVCLRGGVKETWLPEACHVVSGNCVVVGHVSTLYPTNCRTLNTYNTVQHNFKLLYLNVSKFPKRGQSPGSVAIILRTMNNASCRNAKGSIDYCVCCLASQYISHHQARGDVGS